jgi:hypothetical protein
MAGGLSPSVVAFRPGSLLGGSVYKDAGIMHRIISHPAYAGAIFGAVIGGCEMVDDVREERPT